MGLESTVESGGNIIRAHNALIAVSNDPDALAREVAKWSPDIVYAALKMDGGKVLPIAGYFISAGIDVLDPNVWKGIALAKIRREAYDLYHSGLISEAEWGDLLMWISSDPGRANKMLIIYKIQQKGKLQ